MTREGSRGDTVAAVGLLVIALFLGGGSTIFPFERMVVEIAAALVLAWFCMRPWRMPQGLSTRVVAALMVAATMLLLVQLVPLAPSIWHGLPGRERELAVYIAIGGPGRWAPISLDPAGTRETIAFFLVPVAMFMAAMRVGRETQRRLLQVVAVFGIVNGLLVVLQFQGFSWLTFYMSYGRPGTGLFASKNHSALFLVMAMPAVVWTIMESDRWGTSTLRLWVAGVGAGFLALTVFGCLSRAGLALLPIGLALSALIAAPPTVSRKRVVLAVGGLAILLLLLAVVLPQTAVVAEALARFNDQSEGRYAFWPTVVKGVRAYFPVGSGFGTFVPVYAAIEPLSIVAPTFTNHAHSDYMEVALEGGIVGAALIAGFLVWFAATAIARLRLCRWGSAGFAPIAIATAGIAELLLHSALDYPARTLALAALVSVYGAILATRPTALDLCKPDRYRGAGRRHTRSRSTKVARSSS